MRGASEYHFPETTNHPMRIETPMHALTLRICSSAVPAGHDLFQRGVGDGPRRLRTQVPLLLPTSWFTIKLHQDHGGTARGMKRAASRGHQYGGDCVAASHAAPLSDDSVVVVIVQHQCGASTLRDPPPPPPRARPEAVLLRAHRPSRSPPCRLLGWRRARVGVALRDPNAVSRPRRRRRRRDLLALPFRCVDRPRRRNPRQAYSAVGPCHPPLRQATRASGPDYGRTAGARRPPPPSRAPRGRRGWGRRRRCTPTG